MPRPISLAHLTALHASPPELVRLAQSAGYDHVGLRLNRVTPTEHLWPLIDDGALKRETLEAIRNTGVTVLDAELARLTPYVDIAALEPLLQTAAELGARHLLTQAHDPEFSRVADAYGRLCDLAASYDLTCDVEFLTWTDNRDLASTRRLLAQVDRPNVGVCIDTLHFDRSGCAPDEIDDLPSGWLGFVQVADAPAIAPSASPSLIRTARERRLHPGDGGIDLVGILSRLPRSTPLAIEIPNLALSEILSDVDRIRMAREALLGVLRQVEERDRSKSTQGDKYSLA